MLRKKSVLRSYIPAQKPQSLKTFKADFIVYKVEPEIRSVQIEAENRLVAWKKAQAMINDPRRFPYPEVARIPEHNITPIES